MNTATATAQVSLLYVSNLHVVPSPTTACRLPNLAWLVSGTYRAICRPHPLLGTRASLGFAFPLQARHDNRPNRVRQPTDRRFTSSCSPPPLARTQLLSVTEFRPNPDKDLHLADPIHSQTHNGHLGGGVCQPAGLTIGSGRGGLLIVEAADAVASPG